MYRFVVVILLYLLLNYYVSYNASVLLIQLHVSNALLLSCIIIFFFALSYVFSYIKFLPLKIKTLLKRMGSYYFFVFEISLLMLPIANLCFFLLKMRVPSIDVLIITLGCIIGLFTVFLVVYGTYQAHSTVIRKYNLSIPKPIDYQKEMKIVVASDLHLGYLVENNRLKKLVTLINKRKPDVILFPGDVLDDDVKPFLEKNMSTIMSQLEATYGTYAILGNHEYIGRGISKYKEEMKKVNIPVLQDEIIKLPNDVYIVGRDDKVSELMNKTKRPSWKQLILDIPKDKPIIAMDHQPYFFSEAKEAGVDLLLCGHTHRGQFSPNHLVTRRMFELDWGYLKKGTMHVIVSSGFGTWGPPIRLGSRSEIIEITLSFK